MKLFDITIYEQQNNQKSCVCVYILPQKNKLFSLTHLPTKERIKKIPQTILLGNRRKIDEFSQS